MKYMDSNLEAKLKAAEKKRKKHRFLYNLGCNRFEAGKRSFAPFTDWDDGPLKSIWNATKRCTFVLVLWIIIEKFVLTLLIYAVLNLIQLLVGKILSDVHGNVLNQMQYYWKEEQEKYFNHVAPQLGIDPEDHMVHYDDGINVWSYGVNIPIIRDYGDVHVVGYPDSVYDLKNSRESQGYTDDYILDSEIASLKFRNRYQVLTPKSNLLNAVAMVSPVFQLALLEDEHFSRYHSFHTRDERMMIEIPYGVASYKSVYVLSPTSLVENFASVEEHCEKLRKCCDAVYWQVQKFPLLRKGIHVTS